MGVSDACKYDYYTSGYMYHFAAAALIDPYLHWNDKCKLGCTWKQICKISWIQIWNWSGSSLPEPAGSCHITVSLPAQWAASWRFPAPQRHETKGQGCLWHDILDLIWPHSIPIFLYWYIGLPTTAHWPNNTANFQVQRELKLILVPNNREKLF